MAANYLLFKDEKRKLLDAAKVLLDIIDRDELTNTEAKEYSDSKKILEAIELLLTIGRNDAIQNGSVRHGAVVAATKLMDFIKLCESEPNK